ncbi:putative ADP ribosylation factor family Signal recognition particle [Trypanosoma vivax]|uniref:ADP-ribosylation factor-like protein 6 n=1 Tax=Trypanosoma vivax (strain Y486) TaxID=1055687 RepID=G0U198_TRYVY|nr:putative ADP-ribosylation factor [Trypanosoma vivax]KAH8608892.1 putative ADP ribosylation factor family Signal recognition particle [Trypanosoma vivax]CCC49853.1 putative ADP-ribosylation factor [Trypanosoma vivax Y486]
MGQSKTKMHVVVCGLDNSGKTTIINHMKPTPLRTKHIAATVGYNVDKFEKGRVAFTVFDMGGAKKFRGLWETYYNDIDAVIFVVDSSDTLRLCVVKAEIEAMLEHADISRELPGGSRVPFLFYANKMDLPSAKTAAELVDMLDLTTLMANHPFLICSSNALKGTGVEEGFEWLQGMPCRNGNKAGAKQRR